MPPIVRRAPLLDRVKAYLNPLDFLLWLSEELNSNDWEELKEWSLPLGLAVNVVFMVGRANMGSGAGAASAADVFGDADGARWGGGFAWFCSFTVYVLTAFSLANAFYTFSRKRHYRLFETAIDTNLTTPSARRVRVDSSPLSSSPLRFLSNMLEANSAASRAHPDEARDVWQLALWDPTPICLRLFCLFSPGHALVYWLFLPVAAGTTRPSVTVVTAMLLCALLTAQLSLLHVSFSQQSKDASLLHKAVLHEYDTKFVHPSLTRLVREAGTQTPPRRDPASTTDASTDAPEVNMSSPFYLVNRGFKPNPNPAYARHYDPDGTQPAGARAGGPPALPVARALANGIGPRSVTTPNLRTPVGFPTYSSTVSLGGGGGGGTGSGPEFSSPLRPTLSRQAMMATHHRATSGAAAAAANAAYAGDGGSLGVYQHVASPIRKAHQSVGRDADEIQFSRHSPVKLPRAPARGPERLGAERRIPSSRSKATRD